MHLCSKKLPRSANFTRKLTSTSIEFVFATFEMAALIGKMPHGRSTALEDVLSQLKGLIVRSPVAPQTPTGA
jgi:hypothetical protein